MALVLSTGAAPVSGQDNRPHWYGVDNGSQARLIYGVPDSGDSSLIFICDKGGSVLSAYLTHPPVRAVAGAVVPIRLSDGQVSVEFPATVREREMDDRSLLKGSVPLDAGLGAILASGGQLTIGVNGVAARYPLDGAAAAALPLIALCGTAARSAPAADLSVTATNRTRRRIEQIALREPDGIERDSDAFGYDGLAAGRRRTFTIPGGTGVCTYEISVLFEEKEEDCCGDPLPIGQQNLCDDPRIVVHD